MSKALKPEKKAMIPLHWLKDVPTPIFLLDSFGKIEYCNDAFVELTGYRREEIIGAGFDSLLDPQEILKALKDVLAIYEGRGASGHEYGLMRKSGSFIRVAVEITPIYGEGDQAEIVTNAFGIARPTQRRA